MHVLSRRHRSDSAPALQRPRRPGSWHPSAGSPPAQKKNQQACVLSPTPSRDLLPALLEKPLHLGSRAPARPPCFPPFYGEESARSLSLSPSLPLSLPPSLPPSLSLFALLCSGHGVKAGPPPRSVERPHPDILRGWAWLYRGKTLKGNEEKRRVPGRQQKHALITGPANLVLAAAALHL